MFLIPIIRDGVISRKKGAEKRKRRDIYHAELFIEYLPHPNSLHYNYY